MLHRLFSLFGLERPVIRVLPVQLDEIRPILKSEARRTQMARVR
jgi:hypothetical protein